MAVPRAIAAEVDSVKYYMICACEYAVVLLPIWLVSLCCQSGVYEVSTAHWIYVSANMAFSVEFPVR